MFANNGTYDKIEKIVKSTLTFFKRDENLCGPIFS